MDGRVCEQWSGLLDSTAAACCAWALHAFGINARGRHAPASTHLLSQARQWQRNLKPGSAVSGAADGICTGCAWSSVRLIDCRLWRCKGSRQLNQAWQSRGSAALTVAAPGVSRVCVCQCDRLTERARARRTKIVIPDASEPGWRVGEIAGRWRE